MKTLCDWENINQQPRQAQYIAQHVFPVRFTAILLLGLDFNILSPCLNLLLPTIHSYTRSCFYRFISTTNHPPRVEVLVII